MVLACYAMFGLSLLASVVVTTLIWWSFTFPVGTVVTGTSGLALGTGSEVLRWTAVLFFAGLVVTWATVAVRTFHASVVTGRLLLNPQPAPTTTPG